MAEEQKAVGKWHGHTSNAVRTRYNSKTYDTVSFRIHRDGSDEISREQIQAAAAAQGMSVNAWIIEALRDKL